MAILADNGEFKETVRVTGYMAGADNCYSTIENGKKVFHADGKTDTASGVPLNEKYATCAIPMDKSRTNLIVGDVILMENEVNGVKHKSLAWATDVGTMPYGDIDAAKGALEKNLGLRFVTNESGTSVTNVKGKGEISAFKIGHASARAGTANEAILKVNEQIAANPNMSTAEIQASLEKEVHDPANFRKEEATKATFTRPSGGYHKRKEGDSRRDPDDYFSYLQSLHDQGKLGDSEYTMLLVVGMLMNMFMPGALDKMASGLTAATSAHGEDPVAKATAENTSDEQVKQGRAKVAEQQKDPNPAVQAAAIPAVAGEMADKLDAYIKSGKVKFSKTNSGDIDHDTQARLGAFLDDYFAKNPDVNLNIVAKREDSAVYMKTLGKNALAFDISAVNGKLGDTETPLQGKGFLLSMLTGEHQDTIYPIPPTKVDMAKADPAKQGEKVLAHRE